MTAHRCKCGNQMPRNYDGATCRECYEAPLRQRAVDEALAAWDRVPDEDRMRFLFEIKMGRAKDRRKRK